MKNRKTILPFAAAMMALLSTSCSGLFINYDPTWMTTANRADNTNASLICGQAYMKSYGKWIQVHVKKVDDQIVFGNGARPSYAVYTSPGKHRLTILGAFGNKVAGYKHDELPTLDVEIKAGQAYQLLYELEYSKNSPSAASYKLVHIGSIDQYKNYLANNPNHETGTPIPIQYTIK